MRKDKKEEKYNKYMKRIVFIIGLILFLFGGVFYFLDWTFLIGNLTITKNFGVIILLIGIGFIIYSIWGD